MMAGTIAVYKPYSGGNPAIIAYATPCGNTTIAPVNPAIKSAFTSAFEAFFIQLKNGNHCSAAEATFIFILSEIEIR
ncbi:hypothetical protein TUMSATVNIG1_46200 [Vibrio nigripulchritudo]|nr:hypothetical protein VNTUMSATTG_45890 [Vibrio nigripulchritudo]BDU34011.1 hypothetical protein TUMSATVNIG1_46200 [Vibrio nigripulchritudo]